MPNWIRDLLPLVAALAAVWLTQWYQGRRDKKNDERAIRDRRAERLRGAYQELVALAIQISITIQGWRWLPNELKKLSPDERSRQIEQLLTRSGMDAGASHIAVLLESDPASKEVLDTFLSVHEALQAQTSNVIDQLQQPDGDAGKAAGDLAKRAREGADRLSELAREHLARLEKPL